MAVTIQFDELIPFFHSSPPLASRREARGAV
jgi:hypothetical protein